MNKKFVWVAMTAAVLGAACVSGVARAQSSELEALKAQLQALQARVEELEKKQNVQQEAQDKTLDQLAQQRGDVGDSAGRFQWTGDLRYRNETIDQEFVHSQRNRDRIRARFGFLARVNDTVRVGMQAATGESLSGGSNGDARSSNQTLTDANSRKEIDLDLAYVEWSPNAQNRVTLGKMRYPFFRPALSLFYDDDINPEGVAYAWQRGSDGVFGSVWYFRLAERRANADSNMLGAQLGWRGDIVSGMRLTVAATYTDHTAVQFYDAVQDLSVAQNAFGNSTLTNGCRLGITACIASDFDVAQASAELSFTVANRPLSFMMDYARNLQEDLTDAAAGLDTAYSGGVQLGRVSSAHSWEVAALYQKLENNALYAQWIDSDFAGGVSGSEGPVLRAGYSFGRNFRINASYFWNQTNIDLPTTIAGVGPVKDRNYKRLQVDLNMSF